MHMHNLRAVRLTEDSIDNIVEFGEQFNLDLTYLRNHLEYPDPDIPIWYIVVDDSDVPAPHATATEFSEAGFRDTWKFKEPETNNFVPIERV